MCQCANFVIGKIVDAVADKLAAATTAAQTNGVLADVTAGIHNEPVNFWPWIVRDDTGVVLASGRRNGDSLDGATLVGKTSDELALLEGSIAQPNMLSYMQNAQTNNDGYFEYIGFDNYHSLSAGVRRIGLVRKVSTPLGYDVLVVSAYSDRMLEDTTTRETCTSDYAGICAFSNTRRTLGAVTTALLRATTRSELEQTFATITRKELNKVSILSLAQSSLALSPSPSTLFTRPLTHSYARP